MPIQILPSNDYRGGGGAVLATFRVRFQSDIMSPYVFLLLRIVAQSVFAFRRMR